MKLVIIGVSHFDPLCRGKLKAELLRLRHTSITPPAFVAVEWDEKLFREVFSQRPVFAEMARSEWPEEQAETLKVLALSVGFEGDTHSEVFDKVETLWLDEGRQANVSQYAKQRLKVYKHFLSQDTGSVDLTLLTKLSHVAKLAEQPLKEGTVRDVTWSGLLLQRSSKGGADWGVVIVGASHATDIPDGLRTRLEEAGQRCDVIIL